LLLLAPETFVHAISEIPFNVAASGADYDFLPPHEIDQQIQLLRGGVFRIQKSDSPLRLPAKAN
jgi:hypothetical protein